MREGKQQWHHYHSNKYTSKEIKFDETQHNQHVITGNGINDFGLWEHKNRLRQYVGFQLQRVVFREWYIR